MSSHGEDSCHGDSVTTFDSVYAGQDSKPVTRLQYTRESLLNLRPLKDEKLTKNIPSVILEKQTPATVEEEKHKDVKPDQSQGSAGVEPPVDGIDNFFHDVLLDEKKKKKKKKKSSGKNKKKQEPPNGFEGSCPPESMHYCMLILYYRILC